MLPDMRAALFVMLSGAFGCAGAPPPPASAGNPDARLGGAREVPQASSAVKAGEEKLQAGDAEGARALFEQAISADPSDARAHLDLGLSLEMLSQPQQAEEAYRRAVEIQPDLTEALNNLAVLLRARGEFGEAIGLLKRAIAGDADSASAHLNLALSLEDAGDGAGARQAYARAVALDPDAAMTRINYGLLLLALGDAAEGRKQLLAAQQGATGNRAALLAVGNGLRQVGEGGAAVQAIEEAIAAGDGKPTPALYSELALAKRASNDRAGAIESLKAALDLSPDYATAHYLLGNMLAADRRLAEATTHYERYLALAPEGPYASRAKERIAVIKRMK
ncbi:MAG: tetratricopeptide repeat protein [Myxococcales bacterium]|nr:tetratricopeptide repeat protein [Myxococcales bacterium]